jgi:hypothetical protein
MLDIIAIAPPRVLRSVFTSISPARLAVSSLGKPVMCKGILIALLALLCLTICDHYWSNGHYTAAAIMMTKQIARAYGV